MSTFDYQNLCGSSPTGLFRITLNNVILDCNLSYAKLLGYKTPEELMSLKTTAVFSSEIDVLERLKSNGGELDLFECNYVLADGREIRVLQNAKLIYDENNQPIYYEGSILHSTYSFELEDKKRLLEVLSVENPNPVIKVDYDLRLVFQNDAAKQLESRIAKRGGITAPRLKKFLLKLLDQNTEKGSIEMMVNRKYYLFTIVNIFEEKYLNLYATDITELEETKAEYLQLTEDLEDIIVERTDKLNETVANLNMEIATRRNAESKLKNSLSEKEVLLNEITHRVKNNLQVISSLLSLQKSKINNAESIDLLSDTSHRIKSMALIHETLYKSSDFSQINFNSYIDSLIRYINNSFDTTNISIETDVEKVDLTIDTASSCGMIVMELITNSVKYAFPDSKKGMIKVEFKNLGNNRFFLKLSDNGIGLKEGFDPSVSDTLGMQLVYGLTGQLAGQVKMKSEDGVIVEIEFQDTKRHKYE